ncbi:MAG TPA: phosphoribosylglycinamide formyltransferase [Clostridiales bacterium]|nr:phosphoribosylglycinamide formyltransferase [Clostridiales bacterium]
MKGIGVLVSGSGTNLQAIIDAIDRGEIHAKINLVISNRADAYGLVRAQNSGISTCYLNRKKYTDSEAYHQAMLSQLKAHDVEYIVLAGYLYILSPELVGYYRNRIINIHPSLIPAFCGMGLYGQKVHQAVLDYGAKITGATVHFVDEGADTGPIILQKAVEVLPDDTAESLGNRVLKVEHELLPKAAALLVQDKIKVSGRRVSFEE